MIESKLYGYTLYSKCTWDPNPRCSLCSESFPVATSPRLPGAPCDSAKHWHTMSWRWSRNTTNIKKQISNAATHRISALCVFQNSPVATSPRLPGAPSDSAKHWEWEFGKAETQPSPQSKHSTDKCAKCMLQPTLWLPGSPKWHSRVMGVGAWQSRDTRSAKDKAVAHPKEKQQKITYMYKVQLVCSHVSLNSDMCTLYKRCPWVQLVLSPQLQGNKAQGGALGTGHRAGQRAPHLLKTGTVLALFCHFVTSSYKT